MNNSFASDSFYGLGTHEWIGTVLPYASQENQQNGMAGFGIRRRVAIMGYHPSDISQIPDDQNIMICIAMGYPDDDFPANHVRSTRASNKDFVKYIGFPDS